MFEKFFRSFCIAHVTGIIFYKYLTDLICLPLNSLFSYRLPPPKAWVSGVTGLFGRQKSLISSEGLEVLLGREKAVNLPLLQGSAGRREVEGR